MAIDYQYFGKKAYQALKEDGSPATLIIGGTDGEYDIETGITSDSTASTEYTTHTIFKNYTAEMKNIVNPEDVEITFHSGSTPDTIPDLLDEDDLQIVVDGKKYEVLSIEAVRPASVTMIYKARAKEYGSE